MTYKGSPDDLIAKIAKRNRNFVMLSAGLLSCLAMETVRAECAESDRIIAADFYRYGSDDKEKWISTNSQISASQLDAAIRNCPNAKAEVELAKTTTAVIENAWADYPYPESVLICHRSILTL